MYVTKNDLKPCSLAPDGAGLPQKNKGEKTMINPMISKRSTPQYSAARIEYTAQLLYSTGLERV